MTKIGVMPNKCLYSVKQVALLLVQICCMSFVKYGDVLLKMPAVLKMTIIDVRRVCRLISKSFSLLLFLSTSHLHLDILKLIITPPPPPPPPQKKKKKKRKADYHRYRHQFIMLLKLSLTNRCNETCFLVWSGDFWHIPHSMKHSALLLDIQ